MAKKKTPNPAERPFRRLSDSDLTSRFFQALKNTDGIDGAHCIHERWMRGAMGVHIEAQLAKLWEYAPDTIPDWLPTQFIEWLPLVYEVTELYTPAQKGRSNIYLVLLDYSDSRPENFGPDNFGVYVGMTAHSPALRFDQHKQGIRASGSVLKRGLEVLAGPTAHLQRIGRTEATAIEEQLAEALRAKGLKVQGGH